MKKYLIIAALIAGGILVNNYFTNKREHQREEFNRKNLQRQLLDLKNDMIQYQAKGKEELEQYLESTDGQLKGLKEDLEDVGIKLKNVTRVVSTSMAYRDSVSNTIVLDSIDLLIEKLIAQQRAPNESIEFPFEETHDCFWFKAKLIFADGTAKVEVLDRGYNDTITHVGHLERRQWKLFGFIKTRILGRKVAKVELFNNCGDSKTIVIDNIKKQKKQ